jgi:hypothetical protein
MDNLKGKLFVDIGDRHKEVYEEGIGVDLGGQENRYKSRDGDPFQIAEKIKDDGYTNNDNEYVTNLHKNLYIDSTFGASFLLQQQEKLSMLLGG